MNKMVELKIVNADLNVLYKYTIETPTLGNTLMALMDHFPDFDTLIRAVVAFLDSHPAAFEEKDLRRALDKLPELTKYARG